MEKPILATTIKDVIIDGNSWDDAHPLWFDKKEEQLKSKSLDTSIISEWRTYQRNASKQEYNYFPYVDKVMKLLHPNLSEQERTKIARQDYFDSVLEFIQKNQDTINHDFLEYLEALKNKYKIVIITTNTFSALERILEVSNIPKDLFDLIETSRPEEKDNKQIVFDRFINKHGKPQIYIGSSKKTIDYCKQMQIPFILTDFYSNNQLPNSIVTIEELKEKIPI